MRVRFGGTWIADSEHVLLLFEPGRYPVAYFPDADVSSGSLERTDHTTGHPDLGATSWYTVRTGEHMALRAAWQHTALPSIRTAPTSPAVIFRGLISRAIEQGEIPPQDPALAGAMVLGAIIQPALALIYGSVNGVMSDFAPSIAVACSALLRARKPQAAINDNLPR